MFPELYQTLVQSGEQSGQLSKVLLRLADYMEDRHALRQKVALAFIYPAMVTLVAVAVVIGLLTYVVPQVVNVFQNTHQQLPLLTRALIGLSSFLRGTWFIWLAAWALVGFAQGARQPETFRAALAVTLGQVPNQKDRLHAMPSSVG